MVENRNINETPKEQYDEFMSTGGYSKKMTYTYTVILLCEVILGWIVFPIRLWAGIFCLLLSLPLIFLYCYAHRTEKVLGRLNTPPFWWKSSSRLSVITIGLFLLTLSILLTYPFIQPKLIIVVIIGGIFLLISQLARYHVSVTEFWMNKEQNEKLKEEREGEKK